jgi:hypothetical protein
VGGDSVYGSNETENPGRGKSLDAMRQTELVDVEAVGGIHVVQKHSLDEKERGSCNEDPL